LSRRPAILALATAVGAALAALVTVYANAAVIGSTSIALTGAGAVAAALAAALTGLVALVSARRTLIARGRVEPRSRSIEARLDRATASLREAAEVMSEVEEELRTRQRRLQAITADYEQAQALASIDQGAADAIRQQLTNVVRAESRRTFWVTIVVTVLITLLIGVVAGVAAILVAQHWHFGA